MASSNPLPKRAKISDRARRLGQLIVAAWLVFAVCAPTVAADFPPQRPAPTYGLNEPTLAPLPPPRAEARSRWQAPDLPSMTPPTAQARRLRQQPALPQTPAMTLEELEGIAMANNPALVQATMRVRAARGECAQARLFPNPTIGYAGEDMGAGGSAGKQGGFVRQEIVTADKRRLRWSVAAGAVRQAEYALQVQRARVLNDVRTAWYEILVAELTTKTMTQLAQVANEALKDAEALLEAKEFAKGRVLQAQIDAELAQLELQKARNHYRAAWRRFAAVLGTPAMRPTHLAGDAEAPLPELSWEASLQRLLSESPELARARASVRTARSAVAWQCARRTPNVDLRATIQQDDIADSTIAGFEIGMPLPLFDRNQGNIAKARAELIAAQSEVRRIELSLQQRLADAFARYRDARERTLRYGVSIKPKAAESLKLMEQGYEEGEFSNLEVLTARRTSSQVHLAYLESLLQYRANYVAIEGLLLSGGLNKAADGRY